jgi:four helix bundle protein
MRRAVVSICANIAEGCGRRGDRQFRHFLDIAMGSACELECETVLSLDLTLLTEMDHDQVLTHVAEIKRMLSGLVSRLAVSPRGRKANAKLTADS